MRLCSWPSACHTSVRDLVQFPVLPVKSWTWWQGTGEAERREALEFAA